MSLFENTPPQPRLYLPQIHPLIVPLEVAFRGEVGGRDGELGELLAVVEVVDLAVAEVLAQAATDLDVMVRRDRDVAVVKQRVDVGPEEDAVGDLVRAVGGVGADVRGLEDRECLFAADSTAPFVGVGDRHSKSALSESQFHGSLAVARLLFRKGDRHLRASDEPILNVPEQAAAFRTGRIHALPDHRAGRPVFGRADPIFSIEKERRRQDDAPDRWIRRLDPVLFAILAQAIREFPEIARAVLLLKRLPRHADRAKRILDEKPSADDRVMRTLELEKKQLARPERLERRPARPPEIHLIVSLAPQKIIPVIVSQSDKQVCHEGASGASEANG